ncbi:hypothetical protein CIPAW_13G156700 [Carya illinoinensis]|uniref:Uncharacterized protein n=1 Tax=Carya illinoinensis TaxID=32201 RepID=A0A8T1NLB7_CARIL|nr:hypothetical protein CIPAW_13G156700 [Carya illinoinensis]
MKKNKNKSHFQMSMGRPKRERERERERERGDYLLFKRISWTRKMLREDRQIVGELGRQAG